MQPEAVTSMTTSPVEWLAPTAPAGSIEALLQWPRALDRPFAATRRATLAQLSANILRHPRLRADAASVALGYWLRRAQIDRMAKAFAQREALEPQLVHVPAGRVFHLAPGNVDTVFVYSWALAYLCGNQSIVRVSGQQSEVLAALLTVLSEQMQSDATLAAGNRFVTYAHDDDVSAALSRWADHRVVWGGDDTVGRMRALPLSPHASERAFGSKYSWSMVHAAAYAAADEATVTSLAGGFFNDIFWFDQMACSSPHMVVWVGVAAAVDEAVPRFHATLAREIERRGHHGTASGTMHRLNHVFDLACEADLRADLKQRDFLGVRMADGEPWRKEQCGGGLLTHVRVDTLGDVVAAATEDAQTVTHYGFAIDELRAVAGEMGARGVDRLVPVGEALAFDAIWDGYDLVGDFVRRVAVRCAQV
ncbi:MAG: gamma-glutamyl phosphate reductase [Leptothrix sp. (in: Bacteria)]|nr:gamma-glutamyl phosphate reductase [Leptothrix sp. (in: b-proteobacteria)]